MDFLLGAASNPTSPDKLMPASASNCLCLRNLEVLLFCRLLRMKIKTVKC